MPAQSATIAAGSNRMDDARKITLAFGGKWYGNYGVAFCPAHPNAITPALSVSIGREGQLLLKCHAGCDFSEIMQALREHGIEDATAEPNAFRLPLPVDDGSAKRERQAKGLARETVPLAGTVGETYLRSRGITCQLPETLRFHANCWHSCGKRFPAIVARVEGAGGFAVHRTYLKLDGSGKAAVEPPKAMLGRCAGGAVRLVMGDGPLVVAEGIETALSLGSGLVEPSASIWACLSASGLQTLRLPEDVGKLLVATDGDKAGREAGCKLAERAHRKGWQVSYLHAPDGSDWNDILQIEVTR